jgi:ABC-type sugar transport system, periplasmic component
MGFRNIIQLLVGLLLYVIALATPARECVAVVAGGSGENFWRAVERGSLQAGEDLGIRIFFRYLHDESDSKAQGVLIDEAFGKHCIGLVLAPNSERQRVHLEPFYARHLPVVLIDRTMALGPVYARLLTNNYEAGKLAAQQMRKLLHDKGRVTLLRLQKGVASTDEREQGFIDEIQRSPLSLLEGPYVGTSVAPMRTETSLFLAKNYGKFDGLFTPNEMTTLAALAELKKCGKIGQLMHIGFDYSRYQLDALQQGELQGIILQQPYQMGYQGVRLLMQAHRGQSTSSELQHTPIYYLTKDKLQSKAGKDFLLLNAP